MTQKKCFIISAHILDLCFRYLPVKHLPTVNSSLKKAEDFVSYEYDLENMEFNTEKKVVQKAEGNTLPLTVAMFDSDAVFL